MKFLSAICLVLLAVSQLAQANEWQTIRNCRLIENESNDGAFYPRAEGMVLRG